MGQDPVIYSDEAVSPYVSFSTLIIAAYITVTQTMTLVTSSQNRLLLRLIIEQDAPSTTSSTKGSGYFRLARKSIV